MIVAAAVVLALLGGGWLWVRDSSLVAVDRVSVSGESGPDAGQIRSALVAAAHSMTTLDIHLNQLRMAVAPYPVVKRLSVSTQFPHGMRIHVIEQVPVGVVVVDGRKTAVAGDGTLLRDVIPPATLPAIPLRVPPGGTHLTGGSLAEVQVLGAAPYPMLANVSQVTLISPYGLVAQLRNGPSIYFGDSTQLGLKWAAATTALAASTSAGASYIDVTDPDRPAAGAAPDSASAGSPASAGAGAASAVTGSTGASGGG